MAQNCCPRCGTEVSKAEHSEAQGWFLRCWSTVDCWGCPQCFPLLMVRVGTAMVSLQCHLCSRWRCKQHLTKIMVFIRKWFSHQVVKNCIYFRAVHKSSIDKCSADCAHKKKTPNQKLIPSKQGRNTGRSWLNYTLLFWQPNPFQSLFLCPLLLLLPLLCEWLPFLLSGRELSDGSTYRYQVVVVSGMEESEPSPALVYISGSGYCGDGIIQM